MKLENLNPVILIPEIIIHKIGRFFRANIIIGQISLILPTEITSLVLRIPLFGETSSFQLTLLGPLYLQRGFLNSLEMGPVFFPTKDTIRIETKISEDFFAGRIVTNFLIGILFF